MFRSEKDLYEVVAYKPDIFPPRKSSRKPRFVRTELSATEMEALEQSSEEFKAHEKIATSAQRNNFKLQTSNKNIGESIILDAMS